MIIITYVESVVEKFAVYKRFKRYEEGRHNLSDDRRSGGPKIKMSLLVATGRLLFDRGTRITIRYFRHSGCFKRCLVETKPKICILFRGAYFEKD